ncbi:MAG: hypothetical protein M1833_007069 [Piccolia ochrophora]|nr:MAG: hypothetical protein M1833_007069 [Piccolia ochrophora]
MASPPPTSKQSSRWGSFLQQAVAGVESRLDTILAEEDANSKGKPKDEKAIQTRQSRSSSVTPSLKAEHGLSRNPSNSKAQDRLQERLARAMVRKDQTRTGVSPGPSSEGPSRTGSPAIGGESARSSFDMRIADDGSQYSASVGLGEDQRASVDTAERAASLTISDTAPAPQQQPSGADGLGLSSTPELPSDSRRSFDSHSSLPSRQSQDQLQGETTRPTPNGLEPLFKSPQEYEGLLRQIQADYEVAELRRQEETHTYIERIDALQSKLQYLSRESAESARNTTLSASVGSVEKKVAEKDEQIALLMEEGNKLSKTELRQMNTIKKLRFKGLEDEKSVTEARSKQERAETEARNAKDRLKRAEIAERQASDRLKALAKIEKELDSYRNERESSGSLVATLKSQLAQATNRADEAENKAQTDALESERRLVSELREQLSALKIEKELGEEKARAELREVKERSEREKERARIVEMELRGEQSVLESKLEAMRARAEEVSTGATGDAQAKLLRQIETLQTQYAIASENWHGIEGSLMTRVTGLEKERDDLSKRETDIRRKAREINIKSKRTEDDLENARISLQTSEQELSEHKEQLRKILQRAEQSEASLKDAKATFDREKQMWESELAQRLEQERTKWREEASPLPVTNHQRSESPLTYSRKVSTSDFLTLQTRRVSGRPVSGDSGLGVGHERPMARRASTQPARTPETGTPMRRDSMSNTSFPINAGIPETPSIHTMDQDDMFDSQSSPRRTINDMISASTVGAGPSVQLVERMSAAVRRLESEKATSKEELTRLLAQRDEARGEIISLMREVDEKRVADAKIKELEAEVVQLNERYQTTLEMLGEKSELVEELRADIADVKKIYRELVDSTMR